MKTRNGFVSNSSSSSFIVAFDKKPTHSYEVLEAMFPIGKDGTGQGTVSNPYGKGGVDALSAATIVWEQLKDQKPLTKKKILAEIRSGYFEGYPSSGYCSVDDPTWQIRQEYKKLSGKDINDKDADPEWKKKYDVAWKKHWDDKTKQVDEAAKDLLDREFPKKFKGKKCFVFSFSDNDGSVFATLEHGNTFESLPHTVISHH